MVTKNQYVLVVAIARPYTRRSSTLKCFALFENGDQLFQFLIECPSKILGFPSYLENKYYSSKEAAKLSDTYFLVLKCTMDRIGVSSFLNERSYGFLTLISAVTGMFVFSTLAYQRPDFTLLTKIFFITNPHVYSVIQAFNIFLTYEIVKRSVDFSATTINVLTGIWSTDFFSKNQTWAVTERILCNAKLAAKITILAAIQSSEDAQRHLRVHNKLLKPLESYFNPSEVESMDLIPNEFSNSDMILLSDRLNEIDEFSTLQGGVPIQTLLFLLVCRELSPSYEETIPNESPALNKVEKKKLKFGKQIFRLLAYRSPTLRPLIRSSRILTSSFSFMQLAQTSYRNRGVAQQNRNVIHLKRCFESKSLT